MPVSINMNEIKQTPIENLASQLTKVRAQLHDADFTGSDGSIFDEYLEITADSAIILGDCEVPDHDPRIFAMASDLADKYNIKLLVINGDFVACDHFSQFKARHTPDGILLAKEMELVKSNLRGFLKHFDRVAILTGNHEQRLNKISNGHLHLGYFLDDLDHLTFSEYGYLWLHTPAGKYFINHPQNYSRIPLSTSREIAAIRHAHVICGHNHHLSLSRDRSGKYWIIDGGCCRDTAKTQYKRMVSNVYPEWVPGFVMILDGVPFLVSEQHYEKLYS